MFRVCSWGLRRRGDNRQQDESTYCYKCDQSSPFGHSLLPYEAVLTTGCLQHSAHELFEFARGTLTLANFSVNRLESQVPLFPVTTTRLESYYAGLAVSRVAPGGTKGRQWEHMARSRSRGFRPLTWLGGHEMTVLLALACVVAGIWGFALLADEVREGGTRVFDERLLLAFRHAGDHTPLGPPWLQEAARDITSLGGTAVLTLVTLIAAGFLALEGKKHMAVFLCGAVLGGLAAGTILKHVFARPRPDLVPYSAYVSGASFPSGHSMMSAVTYLTLGALLARSQERQRAKAYFLLVAMFLSFAVGVTRVYLGVHWPTDVLAGWTAGAVWALLCWLTARWLQSRRTLERDAEHSPSTR